MNVTTVYTYAGVPLKVDIVDKGITKRIQKIVLDEKGIDIPDNALYVELAPTVVANTSTSSKDEQALLEYMKGIKKSGEYVCDIGIVDLRQVDYHGGTTLSSGVLPKWDIGNIFIKACSLDLNLNWKMDALYEVYAMDLFKDTGAIVADALPVYVAFYNVETRQDEVRLAMITEKFTQDIIYYRELRNVNNYGLKGNDEIIDFTEEFPKAKVDFLNMLVVDYLMNQEDRHSKNFGILSGGEFTPLYDNGCSMYVNQEDRLLDLVESERAAKVKFMGKSPAELISRYCDWLKARPSIDFDKVLANLDEIDRKFYGLMTTVRLEHGRLLIEGRLSDARKL